MIGSTQRAPASVAELLVRAQAHLDTQGGSAPVANSVFTVQHGTRLDTEQTLYRNRYILVRVGRAFGGCAVDSRDAARAGGRNRSSVPRSDGATGPGQ